MDHLGVQGRSSRRGRGWIPAAVLLSVVGALILAGTLQLGLNGDVAYVLGGIEVRGGGLGAAVGTFVHRPLLYRLVLGALDAVAGVAGLRPVNQVPYEATIRLLADAGVALACWLLFRALAPRLGAAGAAAASIATGVALVAAPAWDFLQPEWVASVFVAVAVAAALLPRNELVAGALSGACIVAAVAAKVATAPYAPIALILILLLDRRRALLATFGAVMWGAGWVVVTLLVPHERQWVMDMVNLNPSSPLRAGIRAADVRQTAKALGSKAALSPALLLLPASAVALAATVRPWRTRVAVLAALLICVGLGVATMVVQGAYYLYHLSVLPVLAAGVGGLAGARLLQRAPTAAITGVVGLAAAGVASATILAQAPAWRTGHLVLVLGLMIGFALAVAAVVAVLAVRPPSARRPEPWRSGTLAVVLIGSLVTLAPVLLPADAWALSPRQTGATNQSWTQNSRAAGDTLASLSDRIGRQTPVLYLAYGTVPYHMGNPTDCRYPSPLWLYTARRAFVRDFASYHDNVDCLASAVDQWIILEPGWLDPATLPPDVTAMIDVRYDCSSGVAAGDVIACPRRR